MNGGREGKGPPRRDAGPPRGGRGGAGGPPRKGGRRDEGPPRRSSGRSEGPPPWKSGGRGEGPPPWKSGGRGEGPPPWKTGGRGEGPPPRRGGEREEGPPRRTFTREEGAPWQREQRPPRPPSRTDVAGPPIIPPRFYKPEDLAKTAEKVAAACMEVQRQLGFALEPTTYHRALALEMQNRGIDFEREARIPVSYKERQIDTRRVDFVVEGCIVEVRSQPELTQETIARATNYLKASGYKLALVVNFGGPKLDIRTLTD